MREKFLLRQQEFQTQHPDLQFRTDQVQQLTLSQLMLRLEEAQSLNFSKMQIVKNGQLQCIEGNENIANFNLSSVIIENNSFSADQAVAIVHYNKVSTFDNDETVRQDLISTITFKRDDADASSLYYRLQVTIDNDQPITKEPAPRSTNKVNSFSLLVAHDLSDPKKKLQEFDYMLKDAQIKLRDKQLDELTDEQKLILNIDIPNVSYCVYWGMKYYRQQRFYEALHFLEAAYEPWRKSFFTMNEDEKSSFFDVCYHIGFCYCELQLYKQAYYYLDIVGDIGRIDFAVEHVNALANAGDVRIFRTISNILHDIGEQYNLEDEEEEVPSHICNLVSFLRRRSAYSLIEFGKLDDAEEEFKKLLDDPLSHDYAIQELAYIQNLRNATANGTANDENTPTATEQH
jgi:tetratricopeptide (TPR) repeat protein